ncbi:sulfurase [Euhalothece natronophila Z-M001]|uniref:Sulfurase n=1 Tax=Euhalothece natronophila Z-M001 TaxID=522448 RepID=A0A5B8NHW4_9CHRO|nr:MOSC domain-containing protein [Euhalothece natronophila]QDZ38477.1 sulfurase [Euhalothece natronophila Z-M001]
MAEKGQIEAIWIKRFKGGPMDAVSEAKMIRGQGLVGNADQGGRRQITIIDADAWEKVNTELGTRIDPWQRRANIMIWGIDLAHSRKRILRLGECRVRIFFEAKPCERMDEVYLGLKEALNQQWRGGVCAEVITGGIIRVRDNLSVGWEN